LTMVVVAGRFHRPMSPIGKQTTNAGTIAHQVCHQGSGSVAPGGRVRGADDGGHAGGGGGIGRGLTCWVHVEPSQ
jgi:hypothetical protein